MIGKSSSTQNILSMSSGCFLVEDSLVTEAAGYLFSVQVFQKGQGILSAGLKHIPHFSHGHTTRFLQVGGNPGRHFIVGFKGEDYLLAYLEHLLPGNEQVE